jgi:hypothetical protein
MSGKPIITSQLRALIRARRLRTVPRIVATAARDSSDNGMDVTEPAPADTGSLRGLRGYFVVGGMGPPPPPMVKAFIVRPPFRFLGNLRSLTRSVYYANHVYVNSVDINRSRLEHSWGGHYPSSFASSAWPTYSGTASGAGTFPGILRRQVRCSPDFHGHCRAGREQFEFSEYRQGGSNARRIARRSVRRSGECR